MLKDDEAMSSEDKKRKAEQNILRTSTSQITKQGERLLRLSRKHIRGRCGDVPRRDEMCLRCVLNFGLKRSIRCTSKANALKELLFGTCFPVLFLAEYFRVRLAPEKYTEKFNSELALQLVQWGWIKERVWSPKALMSVCASSSDPIENSNSEDEWEALLNDPSVKKTINDLTMKHRKT